MLLVKVTRKCTSAWEFSLDVLMLISACFGFSTEDPMIQISAFRFPARSGCLFLIVFFVEKSKSEKRRFLITFWHIFNKFHQNSIDFRENIWWFGAIFGSFSLHFFNLEFPIDLGQFSEEKMVSAKIWIPRKPSFYIVKTMVLKVC